MAVSIILKRCGAASFKLTVNCRNTKQIADANTLTTGITNIGRPKVNGLSVQYIPYNGKPIDDGDEDLGNMSGRVIVAAVEDLSENYILAKDILTAYAIVGEESNGTVTYIDRAAIPKMLARKQELTFRNIYEKPFKFTFDGFLLQQSNKTPIFAEKNDSVISHTIVIPFEHTFPAGRAYIKSDYVQRDIVASYYAYLLTVGMDPVDDYDEEALKILEPYKRNMLKESMTTFQFCDEALPGIQLPYLCQQFQSDTPYSSFPMVCRATAMQRSYYHLTQYRYSFCVSRCSVTYCVHFGSF